MTGARWPASTRPKWAQTKTAAAATSAMISPCTDATTSHSAAISAKPTEIRDSVRGANR